MRKVAFMILVLASFAAAQTGGTYDLSHVVIAGGGATNSSGGTYSIGGTIGQALAGTESTGGTYSLRGGFWSEWPLAPTASSVIISGRVRTPGQAGVRGAILILTSPDGTSRQTITNSFGYFRFLGVQAGNDYILQVVSRRHSFSESVVLISAFDDVAGVEFVTN